MNKFNKLLFFGSRNHEPDCGAVCAGAVAGLCVPGGGERSRGGGGPDPVSVCGGTAAAPPALQPADMGGDSDPGSGSLTVSEHTNFKILFIENRFYFQLYPTKILWSEFRFVSFTCGRTPADFSPQIHKLGNPKARKAEGLPPFHEVDSEPSRWFYFV